MKKNQNGQNVRFVRIRGRVVPIHVRQGVGRIAAGAGVAVGTGVTAAYLSRADRIFKKKGIDFLRQWGRTRSAPLTNLDAVKKFGHFSTQEAFKRASSFRFTGDTLKAAQIPVFLGGVAAAGALVNNGIQKLRTQGGKRKLSDFEKTATTQASVAAAFTLADTVYLRARGIKPIRKAAMTAIQEYGKRFSKDVTGDLAEHVAGTPHVTDAAKAAQSLKRAKKLKLKK